MSGSKDLQLGELTAALVPTCHQQAHEIQTMVIVQVGEKHVGDINRANACFHHAVVTARAEIEQHPCVANFEQISGAHSF